MSVLAKPYFHDADKAREHLEKLRWPDGPVCPHCGVIDNATKLSGKTTRPGLYKCNACRQQFTVTVGTLFERSHVPLNVWFQAVYFLCSSKKGMSAHQLHRMIGVTYKTAWFMFHRIREAMNNGGVGTLNGTVEVDETFYGLRQGFTAEQKTRGGHHKNTVLSLVERGGEVKSFHIDKANAATILPLMRQHIDPGSHIMTDEGAQYKYVDREFASHGTVRHMYPYREYGRGPIHTNTIEGYFGIMKRGLIGTYHHVSAAHLHRYLFEFDFRYNTRRMDDLDRTEEAMRGIAGKRLYYRH